MTALHQLASRLERIERNIKALGTPQLAHSSVEGGGAIDVNDEDGTTVMQLGGQFDGTYVASSLTGPTPPTPTTPIVEPAPGVVNVRWDGTFTDAESAPMDFSRIEVHASTSPGFDASTAATLRATIESPRGNETPIILPSGVTHYFKFVTRTLSGKAGAASGEAAETPAVIGVDQATLDAINASVGEAKAAADAVALEVDGIPALIASAKSEAITTSATTAQQKADVAEAAAINAAALTAQAKADTAKAEALTAAAVTAQEKANAAAATAQAAAITAAAADASAKVSAPNHITATQIATDAVTSPKILAGAVVAGKIATDAVTANTISAGAVVAGKLAADSVVAANLVSDAILARHIKAGEITAAKLVAGSITSASGVVGDLSANHIKTGTLDASVVNVTNINAANITVGSIKAGQLAADALDGKVITGARIRTAASGSRWEIGSSTFGNSNSLMAYTVDPAEASPAVLFVDYDGPSGGNTGSRVVMRSGVDGNSKFAELGLSRSPAGVSRIDLGADSVNVNGAFRADLSGGNSQLITSFATGWALRAGYEFVVTRLGNGMCLINGSTQTAASQASGSIILAAGVLPVWARPTSERNIAIASGVSSPSLIPVVAVRPDGGLRFYNGSTGANQSQAIFGVYPL